MKVSIVGGSGYVGGEVTSERLTGRFVYVTHPNLRGRTQLKYSSASQLEPSDCLFLALPHGEAMSRIDDMAAKAPRILDLSADFRLHGMGTNTKHHNGWTGLPTASRSYIAKRYGIPAT